MNVPDLFPEEAKVANESATRVRGNSGDPVALETRVTRSALWAAYGDALGWISELTDAAGLTRRTGGASLDKPLAWKASNAVESASSRGSVSRRSATGG